MADYERIEAQAWKGNVEADSDHKPIHRQPFRIVYPTDPEPEARRQWRRNVPPQGIVRLPADFDLYGRITSRYDTTTDACFQALPGLKDITLRHNVYVDTNLAHRNKEPRLLGFWGQQINVQAATRATNQLLRGGGDNQKPKQKKFVKVYSLSPEEKERREQEFIKRARAEEYRKAPAPDAEFTSKGTFLWGADLGRPDEILGGSYEALDPIRISELCYIIYDSANSCFHILGNSTRKVQRALLRVRGVYFQVAAWHITKEQHYFPISNTDVGPSSSVQLRPFDENVKPKRVPFAFGNKVEPGAGRKHDRISKLAQLQTVILEVLSKLVYFHGHVSMRVRLGQFLLTRHQDKSEEDWIFTKDEFDNMMAQPRVEGEVTQQCCEAIEEYNLRYNIDQKTDIFKPLNGTSDAFEGIKKHVFVATFVVEYQNELYEYEAEFQGESKHLLATISQKWFKVSAETGGPYHLLDASLFDVERAGAASWHFEIISGRPIKPNTLASLQKFSESIKLGIDPDGLSADPTSWPRSPFFTFMCTSEIKVQSLQEKVITRYRLHESEYVVELAKIRKFRFEAAAMVANPKFQKSFLALHVFGEHWNDRLDQNSNLGVGEGARWEAQMPSMSEDTKLAKSLKLRKYVEAFFPRGGFGPENLEEKADGFQNLIRDLDRIAIASGIGLLVDSSSYSG